MPLQFGHRTVFAVKYALFAESYERLLRAVGRGRLKFSSSKFFSLMEERNISVPFCLLNRKWRVLKNTELVPAPGPAVEPRARGIREESMETEPIEIRKAFNSGVIGLFCMKCLFKLLCFCSSGLFSDLTEKYIILLLI
jgi:hypothetical protein